MLDVTVAIAALGPHAHTVPLPQPAPGLCYLVMVQAPPVPLPHSTRADVVYVALDSLGLSHSRNAALAQCQTPLLVFSDSDIVLDPQGLRALARQMTQNPALDFAAGWRAGKRPAGGARAGRYRLGKLNAGRICAPELMVRRSALHGTGLRFDTSFGVGAPLPVGEDYIFVCDMLAAGLRGDGFAIDMGTHPGASTGDDWQNPTILHARRAVLTRCFGRFAPLVRLAYLWRHRRKWGNLTAAWQFWAGYGK